MLPRQRRSPLLDGGPRAYRLGTTVGISDRPFALDEEAHMSRHMAVLGGTGSGKSKFLELLCRRLIDEMRGFCYIDPHGDTVEDLLAYAAKRAEKYGDAICKRIHYLEPTYHTLFAFDPFRYISEEPIDDPILWKNAYISWLETKADSVSEIIQRNQGDATFEGMARLQRWLRNLFIGCGVELGGPGGHLPFADVLVLLNVHHERHNEVYSRIERHLDGDVRADYDVLHGYRRDEDRRKEIESSLNRIRSLLSGLMKGILSRTDRSIDFPSIVQNRGVLLVNLRKTRRFSVEQANALGGLIIHEILETVEHTSRLHRVPFGLFIDESYRFIGTDIEHALKGNRKHKLMICPAAQDLSSFIKKDVDFSRTVLSQCKTTLSFQQQHPEDLKILAQTLGYGNLDFTELRQIVDRPDGVDWTQVEDFSQTLSLGDTWGRSAALSRQEARGTSEAHSLGHTESWADSDAQQRSIGHMNGTNEALGMDLQLDSDRRSRTLGSNAAESSTASDSASSTRGGGVSETINRGVNRSDTVGRTDGVNDGGSRTEGITVSKKWVHLPKTREEHHPTGRLAMSVGKRSRPGIESCR